MESEYMCVHVPLLVEVNLKDNNIPRTKGWPYGYAKPKLANGSRTVGSFVVIHCIGKVSINEYYDLVHQVLDKYK